MTAATQALLLRTILCLALYGLAGFEIYIVVKSPELSERVVSMLNQLIGATTTMAIFATGYFFSTSKGSTDKDAVISGINSGDIIK